MTSHWLFELVLDLSFPWSSNSLLWLYNKTSVQFHSVAQLCPILWDPMNCSTPGLPVHHQLLGLLKLMLVMPSNHLILCRPLLLLPLIFPSIRVFSNESVAKILSFSFNISPSNEHPGLIPFRMDWLDLLVVQGTRESSPTQLQLRSNIHGVPAVHQALCFVFYEYNVYFSQPTKVLVLFLFYRGGSWGSPH